MDELTPQQYEQVLTYMETVNQENFDHAIANMRSHNFNIHNAVNSRYQPANHIPAAARQNNQADDQEIVRKYIEYSRRQNEQWNIFTIILHVIKGIILSIINMLINLLPESLRVRYFGSAFQKLYASKLRESYSHRPLEYYLKKTKNLDSKSVLLIISPKKQSPDITNFLNDTALRKKVAQSFFLCCYVEEHADLAKIEGSRQGPLVVALRWNIFEELVEVGREKSIKRLTAEVLGRWANEGRNRFKRDGNVLVKYRNYIARFHGIHYEEEEEEEVNLTQREYEHHQIQQQNQAYILAQEQTRRNKEAERERKLKEEEERRAQEELLQERRVRKMSIPDEPSSGDIVRISFRCPDGSTILRNFLANEKLELVYHWVELNQSIQFEDQRRHFQIMHSYPPEPLSGKKDRLLSEVFESSQEKVVIKEL